MAVIALVAVVAVVGWARLGRGDTGDEDRGLVEAIPSAMAGGARPGDVPPAVVTAMGDVPVVGVARLDQLPPDVEQQCNDNFGPVDWADGSPTLEYAFATPDSISASLIGKGDAAHAMGDPARGSSNRFRLLCTATDNGGGWMTDSGGVEQVEKGRHVGEFGSSGYSCCDENGLASASGSVSVPEGATWALQDRNGWYLAYPVARRDTLTVTWKFRENRFGPGVPPQSAVTFVDDSGTIIGEDFAGGQF